MHFRVLIDQAPRNGTAYLAGPTGDDGYPASVPALQPRHRAAPGENRLQLLADTHPACPALAFVRLGIPFLDPM
jgi:hypothetical protein